MVPALLLVPGLMPISVAVTNESVRQTGCDFPVTANGIYVYYLRLVPVNRIFWSGELQLDVVMPVESLPGLELDRVHAPVGQVNDQSAVGVDGAQVLD
jgi:hypothetical protein